MPTACDPISKNSPPPPDSTTPTDANNGSATESDVVTPSALPSQDANGGSAATVNGQNGAAANGFTDEDVDYEMPVAKPQSAVGSSLPTSTNGKVAESSTVEESTGEVQGDESSFVFIQDNGFNIKISPPGVESFDLQVSPLELVQEINHLLIDREDTCHRTCFSLQLEGNTLDNFTELKNVEGLKEGSVIKVVEEPYTVREARIHVRHVRDLIKSLDMSDAFNGLDCTSLSFMNIIAQNDQFDQNKNKIGKVASVRSDMLDCLPPDYVLLPGENSTTSGTTTNNNGNLNNNSANNHTSHNNVSNNEIQLVPLEPQSKDQLKTPTCIKVLTASGWNPPPGSRKLRGDLMYLYVVTLEEKRFHITSSSRGFYVNQSTDEVFNPKPANPKVMFHSLVDLLSHISSAFKRNFAQIQKRRHQRHPFERLVTPYQVYAWTAPQLDHTVDSIRAEDAFSSKLGYEEHMPGQTRDWNEELQTTRELPRKTLAERIIRERAVFKVHSDFISAATRGAMAVVDGNVMALNPSEDTKMQMFIWNSIFFSLGFDVRDHYKDLGGDAAAFAAPCNDLHGVRAYSAIDIEGLYTLATAVIDYKGYRVTAQSIIPGILERDQEQSVVHGSIDFGKTVVTNPKYLDLLNKAGQMLKIVPHKVISKNEEEVEICSSVECKGIIGNDGRHYILDLLRTFPPDPNYVITEGEELSKEMTALGFPRQHKHKLCSLRQELVEAFFEARYVLFIKLAAFYLQQSDLKKKASATQDAGGDAAAAGQIKEDEASKDIKSIESASSTTDNPQIKLEELVNKETSSIIDEAILKKDKVPENIKKIFESYAAAAGTTSTAGTAADQTESADAAEPVPTDENALATVTADSTVAEAADSTISSADLENTQQIIRKVAADIGSLNDAEFDIRFNPDIFSPGVTHANADSDAFNKQKQLIKDAAEFLVKVQLPSLIRESLEHSIYLYDGITLTDALHSRGINIRYLGKFADLVSKHKTLDYLMTIVVSELICRSAKHLFANYIQGVEVVYLSTAISHFLNCLLSTTVSQPSALINDELSKHSKRKSKKNKKGGNSDSKLERLNFDWLTLTSKSLWTSLRHEMDSYYGWAPSKDIDSVDSLLTSYSIQKISLLRIVSIRFGVQVLLREYNFDHKSRPAFTEDDIMNVFPIVKHISPRATDAYNFLQTGQRKIQEGNFREGYDYITEALNLFNNVYGPLHSDIVQCLRLLSRINYVLTDYQEACSFQQKAVLMSEKVNGIDHPHTITEYNFLALYSFANSQISASLKFLYRARYLLTLVHSQNHPEIAIIDSNIGLILHAIGEYDYSLHFLEHAVKLNLRYFGRRNLKVALSYHLVARTLSCMGDFRGALNNEKETYMIYKKELGETHDKTKESSDCLRHLTNQAVVLQKKMNEIYKGNANAIIPPIQIQPPSISSVLELLNVINGILFVHISSEDVENLKTAASTTTTAASAIESADNLIKNVSVEDGSNGGTDTASIQADNGVKVMTASA